MRTLAGVVRLSAALPAFLSRCPTLPAASKTRTRAAVAFGPVPSSMTMFPSKPRQENLEQPLQLRPRPIRLPYDILMCKRVRRKPGPEIRH